MIKLFAASLEALEGRENLLLEQLPVGWASTWTAAHPTMHRTDSRVASLAGIWLATQEGTEESLRYDDNGKPHVNGVEISISHTARYVLCAISDGEAPIGLDAEDMVGRLSEDRRRAMAERWFSDDERAEAVKRVRKHSIASGRARRHTSSGWARDCVIFPPLTRRTSRIAVLRNIAWKIPVSHWSAPPMSVPPKRFA